MHFLHRAADCRSPDRPPGWPGAGRDRRGDAVCARLRRSAALRRGRVADRHSLPEPPRRPRNREPVRDRHGRAAGEGRGVLPRQLRRLADQAGAELRFPVRGLHRQPGVQHRRQSRAAGVRVGGAVALRPVARRRAHRRDRDHRCRYRTADPPSSEARRPARGSDRAGVRACRRQPDEHGHDPRVRGRGPGGRRAPASASPTSDASRCGRGTTRTCGSTRWSRR